MEKEITIHKTSSRHNLSRLADYDNFEYAVLSEGINILVWVFWIWYEDFKFMQSGNTSEFRAC